MRGDAVDGAEFELLVLVGRGPCQGAACALRSVGCMSAQLHTGAGGWLGVLFRFQRLALRSRKAEN